MSLGFVIGCKALRKEPKWYLRDHADVEDPGKRAETLIACHLLTAVDHFRDHCFEHRGPIVVPARTLLSQLV